MTVLLLVLVVGMAAAVVVVGCWSKRWGRQWRFLVVFLVAPPPPSVVRHGHRSLVPPIHCPPLHVDPSSAALGHRVCAAAAGCGGASPRRRPRTKLVEGAPRSVPRHGKQVVEALPHQQRPRRTHLVRGSVVAEAPAAVAAAATAAAAANYTAVGGAGKPTTGHERHPLVLADEAVPVHVRLGKPAIVCGCVYSCVGGGCCGVVVGGTEHLQQHTQLRVQEPELGHEPPLLGAPGLGPRVIH
mmetsp:Transcript_32269/g.64320  ORF Transcript_32269/g.64320 Transcript_32269/m.64320 type:complete len:242 (-) Transcript_32269:43-768(-)